MRIRDPARAAPARARRETWTLPLGIAVILLTRALLRNAVPDVWHEAGGLFLLAATITMLALAVARSTRSRS